MLPKTQAVFSRAPECPFSSLLSSLVSSALRFRVFRCPLLCAAESPDVPVLRSRVPPVSPVLRLGDSRYPLPQIPVPRRPLPDGFQFLVTPALQLGVLRCYHWCSPGYLGVPCPTLPSAPVSRPLRFRAHSCPLLRASASLAVPSFALSSRVPQCLRSVLPFMPLRVRVLLPVSGCPGTARRVPGCLHAFTILLLPCPWMSPCLSFPVSDGSCMSPCLFLTIPDVSWMPPCIFLAFSCPLPVP